MKLKLTPLPITPVQLLADMLYQHAHNEPPYFITTKMFCVILDKEDAEQVAAALDQAGYNAKLEEWGLHP